MELLLLLLFIVGVVVFGYLFIGYLLIVGLYRAYQHLNEDERY